jgi:hypothetical protein
MSARWIVLAALCWVGCSTGRQGAEEQRGAVQASPIAEDRPAPAASAAALRPTAAEVVPSASPPTATGSRSWSPWRIVGGPAADGASVGPYVAGLGQWLMTKVHAPRGLALDLPGGARVQLGPDTLVWAFERAPNALLLVRGRLTVQRLPDAPRAAESPQHIVTAHATVSLTAAAELAVGTRSDEPSAAAVGVIVLRGAIELLRFGAAPQLLVAEQSRWPEVAGLTLRGAKTTEEAQRGLDAALRPARARPALADADAHLTAAIKTLTELQAEGDRLLAAVSPRHAAAAPNARPQTEADIRVYQRSLTDHARRAHAAREALQLAIEQSLLEHALECGVPSPDAAPCARLRAWRERFERALVATR